MHDGYDASKYTRSQLGHFEVILCHLQINTAHVMSWSGPFLSNIQNRSIMFEIKIKNPPFTSLFYLYQSNLDFIF